MDKWFQSRTAIQLISLFLAIILWFVVNAGNKPATEAPPSSTTRIEVTPVVYYNEDQFELTKEPGSVIVSVSGKSTLLTQIWMAQRYEVYLDLNQYDAGTHSVPVLTRGFPKGVTVEVVPSEVSISLEEIERKEFGVIPQLIGEPTDGYKAGEPIIQPNQVFVKASNDKLSKIGSVKAYVNVTGLEKDFKDDVALRVFDTNGKEMDVEVSPAVVEVQVPITSPFIKVPLKIDFANDLPDGLSIASITQNYNEVTVYGPKDFVQDLQYYIGPKIDLSTIKDDRTFELRIPLKDAVSKVEPDSVEVRIDVEKTEERTLSGIPVKIINATGEGTADWITPESGELELTFLGAKSILQDLTVDDIQASIDVSALPSGEHNVPVQLSLPNYVKIKGPQPTITIRMTSKAASQANQGPTIPGEAPEENNSNPTGE